MSRVNGQMRTCDRCGKQVFSKTIGDGERDGGYTRWNKFEVPEGWSVDRGDLCPECTQKLKELMGDFWSNAYNEEKRLEK